MNVGNVNKTQIQQRKYSIYIFVSALEVNDSAFHPFPT